MATVPYGYARKGGPKPQKKLNFIQMSVVSQKTGAIFKDSQGNLFMAKNKMVYLKQPEMSEFRPLCIVYVEMLTDSYTEVITAL